MSWWKEKDPSRSLFAQFKTIEQDQTPRLNDYTVFASLYGNAEMAGFTPFNYAAQLSHRNDRVSANIIQSMVDTVSAKLLADKIKPTFLTSGGDWNLQRKAKKLDTAVEGIFYENDAYYKFFLVFRDACIFGTGYLQVLEENGRVCYERQLPSEIFVDTVEAVYGSPRRMYKRKWVDKEVLAEAYPEKAEMIANAGVESRMTRPTNYSSVNVVEVVEAWSLGPKGRHVITIAEGVLLDEPYEYGYFPIIPLRWSPKVVGYTGQGLAEQLIGLQLELNKLLRRTQLAMHLMSVPYYLVEHGSKIVKSHLNNEVGHVVEYSGIKPEARVNQVVHPEVFQHMERLYRWAYEVGGISQLSANSRKPAGLDSEPSLRTFHDIESERFQTIGQLYERFVLEVATQTVNLAGKMKNFRVVGVNKKFMESFKFSDIRLDDSDYVMKIYPTSLLPTTPSARLARVGEAVQMGVFSPDEGQKLLDFPDVEAALGDKFASDEMVKQAIESILDSGEYISPEPFQDLVKSLSMAQTAYLRAKLAKAPENHLALIRQYMQSCDEMLSLAMPQPMPAPMLAQPGGQAPQVPGAQGAPPSPQPGELSV
jgi:hypothetical protein